MTAETTAEKTPTQRLADLVEDSRALIAQQRAHIDIAWNVLYRLGDKLTPEEYATRSKRLNDAEARLRNCGLHAYYMGESMGDSLALVPTVPGN